MEKRSSQADTRCAHQTNKQAIKTHFPLSHGVGLAGSKITRQTPASWFGCGKCPMLNAAQYD